jgi:hypothetical protein
MKMTQAGRRSAMLLTLAALIAFILSVFNPVNSELYRILFLMSTVTVWLGLLMLSWNHKWCRFVAMGIPTLLIFIPRFA